MTVKRIAGWLVMAGISVLLCSCTETARTAGPNMDGWQPVIADDLSNCTLKPDSWVVEDGVLTRKGGGDIWTKQQYGDFVLDLEFKVAEGTNSGIFIRTADIKQWLHTGIEIQVHDSHGMEKGNKHSCGAVYDVKAPSANPVKGPGEWNHITITAQGPKIHIVLNDVDIIDINLDNWTEAGKNPDGSKNKFKYAYADMARKGVFGFQDHGKPVWYRNIRVKEL